MRVSLLCEMQNGLSEQRTLPGIRFQCSSRSAPVQDCLQGRVRSAVHTADTLEVTPVKTKKGRGTSCASTFSLSGQTSKNRVNWSLQPKLARMQPLYGSLSVQNQIDLRCPYGTVRKVSRVTERPRVFSAVCGRAFKCFPSGHLPVGGRQFRPLHRKPDVAEPSVWSVSG